MQYDTVTNGLKVLTRFATGAVSSNGCDQQNLQKVLFDSIFQLETWDQVSVEHMIMSWMVYRKIKQSWRRYGQGQGKVCSGEVEHGRNGTAIEESGRR